MFVPEKKNAMCEEWAWWASDSKSKRDISVMFLRNAILEGNHCCTVHVDCQLACTATRHSPTALLFFKVLQCTSARFAKVLASGCASPCRNVWLRVMVRGFRVQIA